MDTKSKTDSFVVLYNLNHMGIKEKLGQTEMIQDNLNPEFVTEMLIDYKFEEQQNMVAEVWDCDDATNLNNLNKQEFVGFYQFKLGTIVSSRNQEVEVAIQNDKMDLKNAKMRITASQKDDDYGKNVAKFIPSV